MRTRPSRSCRPTLTVLNAIDFQSDPLTHQFEVYADAALTQLVAQVPSVASGTATTSWQVDVDLPDNAPYWWRARASDGMNTGPWCDPVVFNINEFNNPPLAVSIAGPVNDSLIFDGDGLLVWIQSDDPDLGDDILDYQIQIDHDSGVLLAGRRCPGHHGGFRNLRTGFPRLRDAPRIAGQRRLAPRPLVLAHPRPGHPLRQWPVVRGIRLLPPAHAYQRYLRSLYPEPEGFSIDFGNPFADPDGNGVGLLLEFACAIAPGTAPADRLPRPIVVHPRASHQGFEWTARKGSELGFLLEVSVNLTHWQTDARGAVEVLHAVDATSERVRIIDPDPVGSHGTRFIRMRVRE